MATSPYYCQRSSGAAAHQSQHWHEESRQRRHRQDAGNGCDRDGRLAGQNRDTGPRGEAERGYQREHHEPMPGAWLDASRRDTLPDAKYRVVYADPPWSYNDKADAGSVQSGGAAKHYPTMSIQELCDLETSHGCSWLATQADSIPFSDRPALELIGQNTTQNAPDCPETALAPECDAPSGSRSDDLGPLQGIAPPSRAVYQSRMRIRRNPRRHSTARSSVSWRDCDPGANGEAQSKAPST